MTTNEPPADNPESTPPQPPVYGTTPPGDVPPPPPPPTYGAAGGIDPGGPTPFSAADAISYGWNKFKDNPVNWVVAILVIFIVSGVLQFVTTSVQPTSSEFNFSLLSMLLTFVSALVSYVLSAVVVRGALDEVDAKKFSFGDALGRIDIPAVLITSILLSVGTTIGIILCVIPGLVFAFLSWYSLYFVLDDGASPVQAISASIKLVTSRFADAFLVFVFCVAVLIVGLILCGVGLLAAYPITAIAAAYAFRKFQDKPVAA